MCTKKVSRRLPEIKGKWPQSRGLSSNLDDGDVVFFSCRLLDKFDRILVLVGKAFILVGNLLLIKAFMGLDGVVVLQF
jgi:hypothetical protein